MARIEVETAIAALANRLVDPRLVVDPPPYRPGASLRGPARLPPRAMIMNNRDIETDLADRLGSFVTV